MLPDRVSNLGPLTYESGALPIALRGPAFIPTNSLLLSKGCFLLLLLKTRTCTEYTLKILKF